MGRDFTAYKLQFGAVEGHDRRVGSELNLGLGATHASATTKFPRWHLSPLPFVTRPNARRRRKSHPLITNHQPALSAADGLPRPDRFHREGSLTRPERSRRITAFLTETLPIRIASKSFDCIIGAHSNRHSPKPLSTRRLSFNFFISSASFASSRSQSASSTRVTSSVCYASVSQASARGVK